MSLQTQITALAAAGIPTHHVATAGLDIVAAVELVIVVAIAITNWWYKRKKDAK